MVDPFRHVLFEPSVIIANNRACAYSFRFDGGSEFLIMADEQDSIEVSEVFHSIKLEILEEKRDHLTRSLDAEKYLAHLRSKRILDQDDEQVIKSKVTGRQKAETLLDMLARGDPSAFDELCEALLKNKTQVHILQMLLDSFEDKIADSKFAEKLF